MSIRVSITVFKEGVIPPLFYIKWKVFLPGQEDSLVSLVETGENDGKMIRRQHGEMQSISK